MGGVVDSADRLLYDNMLFGERVKLDLLKLPKDRLTESKRGFWVNQQLAKSKVEGNKGGVNFMMDLVMKVTGDKNLVSINWNGEIEWNWEKVKVYLQDEESFLKKLMCGM